MKTSKKERLQIKIASYGGISTKVAFLIYGESSAKSSIHRMRKEGWNIETLDGVYHLHGVDAGSKAHDFIKQRDIGGVTVVSEVKMWQVAIVGAVFVAFMWLVAQ